MIPRSLLLLLGATLAWLSAPLLASPASPAASDRQIMVMLKLAPPHMRAGTGYGGGYGDDAARGGRRRIALRIAREHGLALVDNWPMPSIGVDCFIMAVPAERAVGDVTQEVAREPMVAWSEPIETYQAQASPPRHDDPLFATQPAARLWQLASLHSETTGRGVTVAVIDSQVDMKHPDLAGQIAISRDFVGHGTGAENHGTAVAGIIAARAGDGIGIVGVAPGARIMALRACAQKRTGETSCDSLSLAKAVLFAVDHKTPVINLSLSGPPGQLLGMLLRRGVDQGATVVAAFDPKLPEGGFPASLPGVVPVSDDRRLVGARAVYTAPGHDIPAPAPGAKWTLVDGSSYSTAHVSGLFALLRARSARPPRLVASRQNGGEINACATIDPSLCIGVAAAP